MSNELAVINEGAELATLSTEQGVNALIAKVRENVMSLDGGSMKNKTTRKQIRSNAFKATKAKSAFKSSYIQPLIESLTAKVQPTLDIIQAVKDNEKVLNAGLDKIRKDVNEEVDAFENEIERVAAEQAKAEEDAKNLMLIDLVWDYARVQLDQFNLGIAMNEDRIADEQRKHDEEIARKATEAAELKAEQEKQAEAQRVEDEKQASLKRETDAKAEADHQRQAAIQAEIDLQESEDRRIKQEAEAKRQAEIAEQQRVEREKQLTIEREEQEKANELARIEAEKQALIAQDQVVEMARLELISRQESAVKVEAEAMAKREANKANIGKIRKAQKEYLMSMGVSEDIAKNIVLGMAKGEMPSCKVIY